MQSILTKWPNTHLPTYPPNWKRRTNKTGEEKAMCSLSWRLLFGKKTNCKSCSSWCTLHKPLSLFHNLEYNGSMFTVHIAWNHGTSVHCVYSFMHTGSSQVYTLYISFQTRHSMEAELARPSQWLILQDKWMLHNLQDRTHIWQF